MTGVPVFDYKSEEITDWTAMWNELVAADAANYILGAGTSGGGDDSESNTCGIAMSHAYSIISVFTMTDAAGTEHKCLLIRNPWGLNNYSWNWRADDPNWTSALIAQVPNSFDPTAQSN